MTIKFDNNYSAECANLADFGAKRVLGINGSLTSYINTGCAYPTDTYVPIDNKTNNTTEKKNKSKYILPALGSCAFLVGSAAIMILRAKKVKPKEFFKTFGSSIKKSFDNVLDKIKKIFSKKS